MTTNATPGESSYRNVPIADSGANIPQEIKDADRYQKFKFFECLQALVKGRLPTNDQIDHFLSMAQNSSSIDARAHMLSSDGQALYRDYKELIRTTRDIVYEKNEQELFQNFIYHCSQATDSTTQNVQTPNLDVGISSKKAKAEGKETLDNMVAVAKLITTNSEFRSILNELLQLAREVFGEGATKVADNAQHIGSKVSTAATNASQNVVEATESGNAALQDQIQTTTDAVEETANEAQGSHTAAGEAARNSLSHTSSMNTSALKAQASNMKDRLNKQAGAFKENARAGAAQTKEDAIRYANAKFTPEMRQNLIQRLKVVVGQIQAEPQYQKAIDSVMSLIGTWRGRAKTPAGGINAEASKIISDPNVESAIIEFKIILQRWAQGYPLDPLITLVKSMWIKAMEDPELNQYMNSVGIFMAKAMREPDYVTSSAINNDANGLIDQGNTLLRVKYKTDTDAILNESQTFFQMLNTDPKAQEVAANFRRFASDLFYDKNGKVAFKPHLFDDFRFVFFPAMVESLQFIPIPRIEYSDLKVDLMFDNMILTSTDLLPRFFEIDMRNTIRMTPRGNANRTVDPNRHDFSIIIQGLEANLRNVDYYVKTKDGFRFRDRGVADVLINRNGMDISISGKKTPPESETPSLITIRDVNVVIHSLTIKMRNSKHPVMYFFAQPFIKTMVKDAIARALETQIRQLLTSGDKYMATSIRDTRIKTGKGTFGALMDSATTFVKDRVNPDEATKAKRLRKQNTGRYNRTSRIIFDQDGLCVLDPVKHLELKVGQPLQEDKNEMAAMPVAAPWVSSAFNMKEVKTGLVQQQQNLPAYS
ncbi:hypothetical protein BGZ98_000631 [Dissophora globulifera]|nr:hypothetical protein BGZ98_000631 [Dissophora globulifera]